MSGSCPSPSSAAAVAVAAGLSAAAGSIATAYFMNRKRGRRRPCSDGNGDGRDYDDDEKPENNNNKRLSFPDGIPKDVDAGNNDKLNEGEGTLATSVLTLSSLSHDYAHRSHNNSLLRQHSPPVPSNESAKAPVGEGDADDRAGGDGVGSLNEVSRGISQRHYNAIHSIGPDQRRSDGDNSNDGGGGGSNNNNNDQEGEGSVACPCPCAACKLCTLRESRGEYGTLNENREFRPASVVNRRMSSRARRRSSLPSLNNSFTRELRGSLVMDESSRSLMENSEESETGDDGRDGIRLPGRLPGPLPGPSRNISNLTTGSSEASRNMSNLTTGSSEAAERRLIRDDELATSVHRTYRREEESYISETELKFKGEENFDESVHALGTDIAETSRLLRRTRAISALSNRLMAAPDEAACIEEVTRLLVLMFGVERVSFAMLTGSDHFLLKRVNVRRREGEDATSSAFDLEYLDSDCRRPLEGTAAGVCAKTLKECYTPRTGESAFDTHKVFHRNGVNTVLASPILVNGNKCAGCIWLTRKMEDGFKKPDRALVADIGVLLGANVYAKRLLKDAEDSRRQSREMLRSFIPPKVLAKIECYWDADSDEYKSRKSASLSTGSTGSSHSVGSNASGGRGRVRSNSWYVAQTEWSQEENNKTKESTSGGVDEKIRMIKKMNKGDDGGEDDDVGVIVSTQGIDDFSPTSRALYAESVKNVCIVFTDIVGFSRFSLDLAPIRVMDMLQNLFNRFDELCDVHGVLKLETIGDAYICATNLMEDDEDDGVQDAAIRALSMAKDMVMESTHVKIPHSNSGKQKRPWKDLETLRIRVGVHVGDVTCGVLGQRLPKFTTCGTAVNMAARMEQTSKPGCIRVTKAFRDAVGSAESGWGEREMLPLKNMGLVETYLLNPLESTSANDELLSSLRSL